MQISIKHISREALSEYPKISPAFMVSSVLQCKVIQGGLGGILLEEQPVAEPYVKDTYDVDPEQWKAQFDTSGWAFFIAYEDDIPVGCATVASPSDKLDACGGRADMAVLWDIRVDRNHRRHSIGSQLLRRCADWAKENGYKVLGIETQNVNVPACRFYARQGCELAEIRITAECAEVAHEAMLIWHLIL